MQQHQYQNVCRISDFIYDTFTRVGTYVHVSEFSHNANILIWENVGQPPEKNTIQ